MVVFRSEHVMSDESIQAAIKHTENESALVLIPLDSL